MDKLLENEVLQQILKDSFGGICYMESNRNKYDTTELLQQWENLPEYEKEHANGIIKGAINFIKGY